MLLENITFYNNIVNFSLNVTKFGMSIDIIDIDKAHDVLLLWKPFWREIMNALVTKICVFIKWFSSNNNTFSKIAKCNHELGQFVC